MRTRLVIVGIVLVAATVGTVVALMGLLGPWPGPAAGALGAAVVLVAYRRRVQPWQHRSADRVVPELQDLRVGDQIPMIPGVGPRVRAIEPDRHLVAGDSDGGTWCLALRPVAGGTRLVSRWRVHWAMTPATAFWVLLSDPGAFIMERRMLKGLKARVERAAVHVGA